MQKKIITLAIAGLVSGAAFAQSNVTIYGVADAFYGRLTATGKMSNNHIGSGGLSGSRLGFKGSEDLGGGLKAVFEYELAFNLDNTGSPVNAINDASGSNGLTGTRQSFVGLGGGFGTIVAGRLQTPGYYVGRFDAFSASQIGPQAILGGGALRSTISPTNHGRVNNAVAYLSPTMSGFSAVLAYGTGEETTPGAEKENVWGLGLNYAQGPIAAGFAHHRVNNVGANNVANATFPDLKENMIGLSYDAKVVRVLGSYQDHRVTGSGTSKLWQLGAVAPVGAGNVHFAYGKLDRTGSNNDSKSWTLAYTHGLSKRTTAYVGYNRTTNESLATAGILAPNPGGTSKAFVAGMRHSF